MKAIAGFCLFLAGVHPLAAAREGTTNAPPDQLATKRTIVLQDVGWSSDTGTSDCTRGHGNDVWQLTVSRPRELRVTVTDLLCPGDFFEVYVDGRLIGKTPNLAPPWGCRSGGARGPNSSGQFRVVLTPGKHTIRVRDAGLDGHSQAQIRNENMCPAGFRVAGRLFDAAGLTIVRPTDRQDVELSAAALTATGNVAFEARGGAPAVQWETVLEYQTSGGRGATRTEPYRLTRRFSGPPSPARQETFKEQGGQITVKASGKIGTQTVQATPVKMTITGAAIGAEAITQRLRNLYSDGATPRLMTGVAQRESSYLQFSRRNLYGRGDLWPRESFDGGSHIGLMMLPTTGGIANAWSWLVNTQKGVALFREKLAAAGRLTRRIRDQHPGLRELTPLELENMALILYGPHASGDLGKQYYAPVRAGGGWSWRVNTAGNGDGVAYADQCRSLIRKTGGPK